MRKNKELQKFYKKVYKKGEKKHFTTYVIKGKPSAEHLEVLKEDSWKGKSVLDVGCGTGLFSYLCAKKGANVLGIDYADEAIDIANKTHYHKNLEFKKMDVSEIKEKFDVIVSIGTLEHMDNPFEILKSFKSCLKKNGKIIITNPNWTNPRGYVLMTLLLLFDAPVTLADIHHFTPVNHLKWAKKLKMKIKWRTIEKSWAHGDTLITDFERRLPNVLRDAKLPNEKRKIDSLITWIKDYVNTLDNSLPHSGAIGVYTYEKNR